MTRTLALAVVTAATFAASASAQDRAIPSQSYFGTLEELYRGEYQDAERGMRSEVRGGLRIGLTQWVDSICYRAALGEVYYQMGDPRRALAEYDAACELFLSYPTWLLRVEFRQPLRPDANPARRRAPWGAPTRPVTYAALPETMLVQQGEMITEGRLRQGGAMQSLQMWRVNVVEVVRSTALAIRRRNELLGPLGEHDRMSKNLVDALARGGNAPRNHWSNAWTEILLGLAQLGIGESQQAVGHLNRGILLEGRYDHPLTGVALLGQAAAALQAGNAQAALNLATEASYAGYAYDDYDVVGASIELGHQAFLLSGAQGTYAVLPTTAQWADREGLDLLAAMALISEGEQLVAAGQTKLAAGRLNAISARRRGLNAGRLGPPRRYVEAFIAYVDGKAPLGDKGITEALAQNQSQSLRSFQIALTNARVDSGQISSRIAVDLYASLLRDPVAADWGTDPLETLTQLTASHEGAFGRWLIAALSREEVLPAINITDMAKRRRFWLAQPIGGRLLALRHLLESDPNRLPAEAAVERRNLLLRVPEYTQLAEEAQAIQAQLHAEPLADDEGRVVQQRYADLKRLATNAAQREALLRQLVLRRDATDMLVPPPMTAEQVQGQLALGQAVVLFHQAANSLFAFVLTHEAYHTWRIPEAGPVAEKTAEMLRAMGHFNQTRTLNAADLATDSWNPTAQQFGDMVLGDSRLDLGSTSELVIVPDGVLWHVPFEALQPSTGGNDQAMIDRLPIRYAPTLGYAAPDRAAPSPIRTTIVAAAMGTGAGQYLPTQAAAEIADVATGAVVIDSPVSAASPLLASLVEQIVVLTDSEIEPDNAYAFQPLPLDRSNNRGTLASWLTLPLPGCQRLLLGGVHTAAETGLKSRGRGRNSGVDANAGAELFQASCALLASGGKTVLLSRWQTGGKTHRDLLREFTLELPHVAADQAWRRSVALARQTELDPDQEPRFERPAEGAKMPTADHPFLWSGYLMIDTGYDPAPREVDAQ